MNPAAASSEKGVCPHFRIGYFDCFAGASGDMILAALLDAGLRTDTLAEGLAALGLKDIEIKVAEVSKRGIRAKSFGFKARRGPGMGAAAGAAGAATAATAAAGPGTGTFREIVSILEASSLTPTVKARALGAFDILAEAEGRIHGQPKAEVHFHEVGSLDSLVDVVGAFLGLEALGIDQVVSSPIALGGGKIECAHGTLPAPAPATVEIARGLPVRGWSVEGELTTPTGAAILKACASAFGPVPEMTIEAVGYGAGTRDLEAIPNVMRLIVGTGAGVGGSGSGLEMDRVTLLETNIDDMNPQNFSHLYDDLFQAGALDVWVENILMKKGRPGFLVSILADASRVSALADIVLAETTTAGIRFGDLTRIKLPRRVVEIVTRFGTVKAKVFTVGGRERCGPEYSDCLRCARAHGVAVGDVMEEARHEFRRMSALKE